MGITVAQLAVALPLTRGGHIVRVKETP